MDLKPQNLLLIKRPVMTLKVAGERESHGFFIIFSFFFRLSEVKFKRRVTEVILEDYKFD